MTIKFEIPPNIEQELSTNGADLNSDAREAFLVELYRQERITQHQLAEALGLSRLETDGVLKKHKVWLELTREELAGQAASLREARPE
jgi:predicted HTH domain antitoxin